MENYVASINSINTKRSTRKYDGRKVDTETLVELCKAGLLAPSGMNIHDLSFLVINDEETADKFVEIVTNLCGRNPFYGAKSFIVCYGRKERVELYEDVGAAIENILLEADNKGILTCWIHATCKIKEKELYDFINSLTDNEDKVILDTIILGYGEKNDSPRKFDEIIKTNIKVC